MGGHFIPSDNRESNAPYLSFSGVSSKLPHAPLRFSILLQARDSLPGCPPFSKHPTQDFWGSTSHSHSVRQKSLKFFTTQSVCHLMFPLTSYSLLSLGDQALQRCPRCTLSGWGTCQASLDCSVFPLQH